MEVKNKDVVIDFETYYEEKTYSVRKLGPKAYCQHHKFDAYLVSIVNDDISWVGHPSQFDWKQLNGFRLGAHNAQFDKAVLYRLMELGVVPEIDIEGWFDTADLAAYLACPRNLAGAVLALCDVKLSKAVRTAASGKTAEDMKKAGKYEEMVEYALDDSKYAWKIWKDNAHKWPEKEYQLSLYTRQMCDTGLPLNKEYLESCIESLDKQLFEARSEIPWVDSWDEKYKKFFPILSPRALRKECAKYDIPPPTSVAKDSEECEQWLDKYGEQYPFVRAMRDYRRINTLLDKFQTIKARSETGRMDFGMKYWGAHTGRWSGDGGFNVQNLPRGLMYGCDMRNTIQAPEGKVFIVSDLSQIEPRCLYYIINDTETLDLIKQGVDVYEAHARTTMGYDSELPLQRPSDDPDKEYYSNFRSLAKERVLSLNYGAGWYSFYLTLKGKNQLAILDREVTEEERDNFEHFMSNYTPQYVDFYRASDEQTKQILCNSWLQVSKFRQDNPKITDFWKQMGKGYKNSVGDTFSVVLPSGRRLNYFGVRVEGDNITAKEEFRGKERKKFYGSKIVENIIQATARDVFAESLLAIFGRGYKVINHIHDEVIIEANESKAEGLAKGVSDIFATPPAWLEGCPLASDYSIVKNYTKV